MRSISNFICEKWNLSVFVLFTPILWYITFVQLLNSNTFTTLLCFLLQMLPNVKSAIEVSLKKEFCICTVRADSSITPLQSLLKITICWNQEPEVNGKLECSIQNPAKSVLALLVLHVTFFSWALLSPICFCYNMPLVFVSVCHVWGIKICKMLTSHERQYLYNLFSSQPPQGVPTP